jgi:hypothetical protein
MTDTLSNQMLAGIRSELKKYINTDTQNVDITAEDLHEIMIRHAPKEKPKRPKNSFFFWMDTLNKEDLQSEHGEEAAGRGGLKRLCGRIWKEMANDSDEKMKYVEMANDAKGEYAKAMEEYKTTEVVSDSSSNSDDEKPKKKRGRKPKKKDDDEDDTDTAKENTKAKANDTAKVNAKAKANDKDKENDTANPKKRGRKPKNKVTQPPPEVSEQTSEDEMEVDDFEYCGVTYLLDKSSGNLYPEDAESTDVPPIGKKKGSKVVIF